MSEQKGSTVIHPDSSKASHVQEGTVTKATTGEQHLTKERWWQRGKALSLRYKFIVLAVVVLVGGFVTYRVLHKPPVTQNGILVVDPNNKRDNKKLIDNNLKAGVSGLNNQQKVIYYQNLASEYATAKDYNNELAMLKKAEAVDPNQPQTLEDLGYAYTSLGQKSQAADYYNKALVMYKQQGDAQDPALQEKIKNLQSLVTRP